MKVYDRFLMELANQQYFSAEQYEQFLLENNLNPADEYIKADMQKDLLFACIDVLEAVCNDIDTMTTISTEFTNIGQAYEFIEARIVNLRDKIAAIPDPEEEHSCFSLMYTRGGIRSYGGYIGTISDKTIDELD